MVSIGSVIIPGKYVLAPLAGVSCTAFRMLCKENGADLIYTQMIDASIISKKTYQETERFLNIQPQEHPITVQLIGNDKKNLAQAVKNVEPFADIIDLNLGCIEEDYLMQGSGAALLKHTDKIMELIAKMIQATSKPITAKLRIGWDAQTINAVQLVQDLEEQGIHGVCIHGRTAQQKYAGKVNWTIMKHIKEKVHIPIIANGDVTSRTSGDILLSKTCSDLVMIGREAMHRPWVFAQQPANIKEQINRFIDLYIQFEQRQSVQEVSDHVFWMLRDYSTNEDTKKVHLLTSISQIRRFVNRLL